MGNRTGDYGFTSIIIKLVLMKSSSAFIIMLLFVMYGCKNPQRPKQTLQEKQKELEAGKLSDNYVYTAKEVGWTAVLPEDWQVLTRRDNYNLTKKGKEAVEDAAGTKIDDSKLIYLVNIRKDLINSFQSTMEPLDGMTADEYDNHTIFLQNLIRQVYKSKGIDAEYGLGAVRIDGVMFDRFEVKLYSSGKKKVILEQKLFNAMINGYDFGMTINFNNEADEKTLMNIVMRSKFSIK